MPYTIGRLMEDFRTIAYDASSDFWAAQARQIVEESLAYFFQSSWPFNVGEGVVKTVAPYSTGTVAVVNGSASVTGTGTTWLTSWVTPAIIRIEGGGGDCILVSSFDSGTTLTLDTAWPFDSDATATYSIEFPNHTIPNYIDVKTVTMSRLSTAMKLTPASGGDFLAKRPYFPSTFWPSEWAVTPTDGTSTQKLEVWPAPADVRTIRYEYVKAVPAFKYYRKGTADATNGNTALTGTGTTWTVAGMGYSAVGQYFEFLDQPNHQVAISALSSATALTLVAGGWTGVTAAGTPYAISQSILVPDDLKPLLRAVVRWKYLCRTDPDRAMMAEREMRMLKGQAVARLELQREAEPMGPIDGTGFGYDWGGPPPTPSILRAEY